MVDAQTTSTAIESLYGSTSVVHGDGHSGNVKQSIAKDAVEVVDLDRAFFANSDIDSSTMVSQIRNYAKPDANLSEILKNVKSQGMDRTRNEFLKIADSAISGVLFSLPIGKEMFLATKPKSKH
jgi:hypothetical protein